MQGDSEISYERAEAGMAGTGELIMSAEFEEYVVSSGEIGAREGAVVVVVGGGVGGVATAARLAHAGHKVLLLEKNSHLGGRCSLIHGSSSLPHSSTSTLEEDARMNTFRFDQGPSLYLMPDSFKATFDDLGEDINHHLTLLKCDPNYTLFFHDGTQLNLSSGKSCSLFKFSFHQHFEQQI